MNFQSLTNVNNATIVDDNFANNDTQFEIEPVPQLPSMINKKKSAFSILGEQIKNKLNLRID